MFGHLCKRSLYELFLIQFWISVRCSVIVQAILNEMFSDATQERVVFTLKGVLIIIRKTLLKIFQPDYK